MAASPLSHSALNVNLAPFLGETKQKPTTAGSAGSKSPASAGNSTTVLRVFERTTPTPRLVRAETGEPVEEKRSR